MDYYTGRTIRVLCKGNEIIRILEEVSEENMDITGKTESQGEEIHTEDGTGETEESLGSEQSENETSEDNKTETVQEEKIRVLIQASDYSGKVHDSVIMTSSDSFTLGYEEKTQKYEAGSLVTIDRNLLEFAGGRLKAVADHWREQFNYYLFIERVERLLIQVVSQFYLEDEGIVVVNEVELEEYLCLVVPSEMPVALWVGTSKSAGSMCKKLCMGKNTWRCFSGV